ncbi:transferrin isoform X2 [Ischnura elegans]|nr:transferrin isoform X2 [Ischnura elegans]
MDQQPESPVACVITSDRLECLRLLTAEKADFAVLEAEDLLVASKSSNPQILVTSELRLWRKRMFEKQMLVIVRNTLNITSVADLRGKKFCHPGYDLPMQWTDATSKYFESQVAPQFCEPNISMLENFIKSSSEFFGYACKPGPWVEDKDLDAKLKSKYSNLCRLCDLPQQCGSMDKYWGPEGSLTCLSDEVGDVAWAQLSHVLFHFGIDPDLPAQAVPAEFSALCPNGTLQPLAPLTQNSPPPCSWMSRPWSVVAARSKIAEDIKKLIMSINETSPGNWQFALRYLLTKNHHEIIPTEIIAIEDYLAKAVGFVAASEQSSCGTQRAVRWCVASAEEVAKCSWLREAALAHGLEPPLSCVRPRGDRGCIGMLALSLDAEVAVVHAQNEALAKRLGLKPLMYEDSSKVSDHYVASLIVKANSKIKKLSDLQGKKACFMNHLGIGWNSLLNALSRDGLLPPICPYEQAISRFFSESCVPGLNTTIASQEEYAPNLESLCRHSEKLKGRPPKHLSGDRCCREDGDAYVDAMHCLVSGDGDVAIVDMGTVHKTTGQYKETWAKSIPSNNVRVLCMTEDGTKSCHIGWSPKGLVMSNPNVTEQRREEVYVLLLLMDYTFGQRHKAEFPHLPTPTPHFTMYGPYDGHKNIIFQDSTNSLVSIDTLKKERPLLYNYEDILNNVIVCSSAADITPLVLTSAISLLLSCIS